MIFRRRYALSFLLALAAAGSSTTGAQRPAREGFVITPDSASLYYRVIGSGADTIIAIHGGPGVDLESIAGDFAPLGAKHVVIFYDQRGTGKSTLPLDTSRLNATQQVADLDAIRRQFGLAHVTLVAHSYGPLLAATYAIAHPEVVRRMVFFGPVPPRRGAFWTRFGKSLTTKLDSAARIRMAAANQLLSDTTIDARQACRSYWAEAMRPRLAEPDRTLPLIKSDLCAFGPGGNSLRAADDQPRRDGILWRLGYSRCPPQSPRANPRRPRRRGVHPHGPHRRMDHRTPPRSAPQNPASSPFHVCRTSGTRVASRGIISRRAK